MAVTNEYSTQITNQDATPRVNLDTLDKAGKVRVAHVTFTQGAAAGDATSTQTLCELPGRCRVLKHLSKLYFSAFGGSRTLDVGLGAYTNERTGVTVVASTTAFASAVDVSSAGSFVFDESESAGALTDVVVEGAARVIAIVSGGTIPAAATIKGDVFYVVE